MSEVRCPNGDACERSCHDMGEGIGLCLAGIPHVPSARTFTVRPFADARVGDHAYTWENADPATQFDGYRFETAGDPSDLGWCSDEYEEPIIRKRWQLMEIEELPADKPEEEDE